MKLAEIAKFLGVTLNSGGDTEISGVAGIEDAGEGDITFIANPRYAKLLEKTAASAVIVPENFSEKKTGTPCIMSRNPGMDFIRITGLFANAAENIQRTVHSNAIVGKNVTVGKNTALMPYCVVQDDVIIGDNAVIYPFVYIGRSSSIGNGTVIYPMVSIRENTVIGNNCIIHGGTVIGGDGFGYITVNGIHHKIPQNGRVMIEDNVEIGANTAVDRARLKATIIKKGTKIDNLVQIAHNAVIGENCIVVAQTGIAGSAKIGKNVTLAAQSGVGGHIEVGDNTIAAGRAGVTKNTTAGSVVSGFPARPHIVHQKEQALVRKLPAMNDDIKTLKSLTDKLLKKVEQLENETKNNKKSS